MGQSTPLDKIENDISEGGNATDDMRVQRILHEINGSNDTPGNQEMVPQQQGQMPVYQDLPMQQQQQQMQQQQPNYHMYQPPNMVPPQPLMGPGMVPYQMMQQQQQQEHYQNQQQQQQEQQQEQPVVAKKNIWAHITDALKMPFIVAALFFILSLPIVDKYLSKYAHWAFSSGGQLSVAGIAVKAVFAGTLMGVYDVLDSLLSRFF
jgi:hypothetical protein